MTATVNPPVNGYRPTEIPAELLHLDLEALEVEDSYTEEQVEDRKRARTNPLATVVDDLRTSWAAVAEPPSLTDWLTGPTTSLDRVPDGNPALRWAWTVDNWATGVLFLSASIALFGAAATFRWLACHPARRWSALLLAAATGTYLYVA
jgi:hypothetical protein